MRPYEVHDPRFEKLMIGHVKLEHLWTGARWAEGPVYVPAAKSVVWSDIPNDRLLRLDTESNAVSVFEHPCGFHNGHTIDVEGRIIACEHGGRRISRLDHDGIWRPLVERFEGKRFNSPNDATVHSDGSIWFTDPAYGIDTHYEGHKADSELDICAVYRLDPASGAATRVIDDMVRPNGICFSPDERILYVADTGRTHEPGCPIAIRAYDVGADGRPTNGRIFASRDEGLYDGFRVDQQGNVWTSAGETVAVHAPDGTHIGTIPIPELVSNLCFGGRKRNRLFITAQTSLYSIYVNAHPAGWRG